MNRRRADRGPTDDNSDPERRPPERTIALTDAVAAIAMTLLVLPLIELIPEISEAGVADLFTKNIGAFFAFALSFLVIYQFWTAHDRLYAAYPTRDVSGATALHGL